MGTKLPPAPAPSLCRGLESLPEELLIQVAKCLEGHDGAKRADLRNLSLVSTTLLASGNAACSSLSLAGLKASRVPRLVSRFSDLTSLNLTFLFDCSEDTLLAVGQHGSRLRELHVPDTFKASAAATGAAGQGLLSVCSGCPNLETLTLPSFKGPAEALLALGRARRLKTLHLRGAQHLNDAVVAHIAQSCPLLEEIDVSFCAISDASLRSLGRCLPRLRKLDLKHCKKVSGCGIAVLAKGCRRLQTLHLGVLELDDSALLALGGHCRGLEELSLDYGASTLGPLGQDAVAALAQGCSRLRVLSLRGSRQVDDQSLRGLAKGCAALEELDLHACAGAGDVGLHSIVLGCKKLKTLVLTGTSVGAAGLSAFEGGLPLLAALRLNGELISDLVLRSVAKACPGLIELHLNGCRVSDGGVESLLCACKGLQTLIVKSCADVKGTAFAAASLPSLHTVHLPSCGLTDSGLQAICAAAPSLANLVVSCCSKLTAKGCAEALRSLASLSTLVLTGCTQLSRADVVLLTKAAGDSLKHIRVSRPGSPDDEYTLRRIPVGWSLPCWARGTLGTSSSAKY